MIIRRLGNFNHPAIDDYRRVCHSVADIPTSRFLMYIDNAVFHCRPTELMETLSHDTQRLLAYGIKFIPESAKFVRDTIYKNIDKFQDLWKWSSFFGFDQLDDTVSNDYTRFTKKERPENAPTIRIPPVVTSYLDRIRTAVDERLEELSTLTTSKKTYLQRATDIALSELRERNLVVSPADKNLGLTVMSFEVYDKLAHDFLKDSAIRIDIPHALVFREVSQQVDMLINHATRYLNADVIRWLRDNPAKKFGSLYVLPKLHKPKLQPRPIVSAGNEPFTRLSQWAAGVLNPAILRVPFTLRSTNDVTRTLLETEALTGDTLITYDVTAMYPNMKLQTTIDGVYAVIDYVYGANRRPKWLNPVVNLIRCLFENFHFTYNGVLYKQTGGVAMGTNVAPALAQCYLFVMERQLIMIPGTIVCKRLLDDGLLIARGEEATAEILRTLTTVDVEITPVVSTTHAVFLDLTIYKPTNMAYLKRFWFQTFYKPTNQYLFIPPFSSHHPKSLRSWIYGEMLRYRNTCCDDRLFFDNTASFIAKLRRRGYSTKLLNEAIELVPDTIAGPLERTLPPPRLKALADTQGIVWATSAPKIIRAPFAARFFVDLGAFVRVGLDEAANAANAAAFARVHKGASKANPNPIAPPSIKATKRRIVTAVTVAPNLGRLLRQTLP